MDLNARVINVSNETRHIHLIIFHNQIKYYL